MIALVFVIVSLGLALLAAYINYEVKENDGRFVQSLVAGIGAMILSFALFEGAFSACFGTLVILTTIPAAISAICVGISATIVVGAY